MNKLQRFFNLSIFGRTFLLILAALVIAESIGVFLILNRPPARHRPVSTYELAQALGGSVRSFNDSPSFGPPSFDASSSGPPGPPPDMMQSPSGPPANDSAPPDFSATPSTPTPSMSARTAQTDMWPNVGPELRASTAQQAPEEPDDINRFASENARRRLAAHLGVDIVEVQVFVKNRSSFFGNAPMFGNDIMLDNFIAARRMSDSTWRIIESAEQRFPTPFQRQALWLFLIGLLFLLPVAWIFSRALSIPITNFARAAKRLGADSNAPPLPVEGPKEMHAAIESFNAMQERLNGLLRERTEMIAAIAHDLRTPLTRLAFRLDDLPAPLNEKVMADINEMKSMISLALDFIRDRSQGINRQPLDFRLLVESVVDDQTDLGRDVSVAPGPAVTLEGDPLALRRVVMNVVDNAIKYGERARLQLTVTDESCLLDIDDDGPGINESLHKRVFEPFFRVENSRNRDTGGVGLGLAVVRAIIQEHAGEIQLRNRSPKGLRVTIKLPRVWP
ncbi:MAG: HAMP domain-containing sensor histidine kinase [Spongiibacteraceae bacterium]